MNAQSQQISRHPPGTDFRETPPGRIKVFASAAAVAEYLPSAWLTALRAAGSGAAVALSAVNSAEVAEAALTGAADIGFVEGPGVPDGLRAGPAGRDTLTVVVARPTPKRGGAAACPPANWPPPRR